jgi:hypothetical protein
MCLLISTRPQYTVTIQKQYLKVASNENSGGSKLYAKDRYRPRIVALGNNLCIYLVAIFYSAYFLFQSVPPNV